jgi:hypothetical protein
LPIKTGILALAVDLKKAPTGWWIGLWEYYIEQWRLTLNICLFCTIAVLAVWSYTAAPFVFGRTVTMGKLTGMSCGSRGYGYTYAYSVQGVLYAGESGWGGLDGNPGTCSRDRVGQPVRVTYSPMHPERNLGGTIEGRFGSSVMVLIGGIVLMTLFGIPAGYIKERWQQRSGQAQRVPASLSRQQRRALKRREWKADKLN